MTTINMDKLRKHAIITFEAIPELIPVKGNASAIDAEQEGNVWAWCLVICRAQYAECEGRDYLGECSYKDEEDFLENSGYADDMRDEALEELANWLEMVADKLLAVID